MSNATAQHNLTVSMASNEALSKALDQLHTTPDVAASSYDYVLSDDFTKGLVLPIEIKPDGKKSEAKAHSEMQE